MRTKGTACNSVHVSAAMMNHRGTIWDISVSRRHNYIGQQKWTFLICYQRCCLFLIYMGRYISTYHIDHQLFQAQCQSAFPG